MCVNAIKERGSVTKHVSDTQHVTADHSLCSPTVIIAKTWDIACNHIPRFLTRGGVVFQRGEITTQWYQELIKIMILLNCEKLVREEGFINLEMNRFSFHSVISKTEAQIVWCLLSMRDYDDAYGSYMISVQYFSITVQLMKVN